MNIEWQITILVQWISIGKCQVEYKIIINIQFPNFKWGFRCKIVGHCSVLRPVSFALSQIDNLSLYNIHISSCMTFFFFFWVAVFQLYARLLNQRRVDLAEINCGLVKVKRYESNLKLANYNCMNLTWN